MSKKFTDSINGKGYYIALILCAVAIGISGYLYYRNANKPEPQLNNPNVSVSATKPHGDVPAIATQPTPTKPTQPTQPAKNDELKTAAPLEGQTVMGYAMDALCYNQTTRDWRVHNGIDIAAEAGTQVLAAADGTVERVFKDDTMGTTVVITHTGGYTTTYASLAEDVSVKEGDSVTLGQAIGCVGQTALLESAIGDHLHFSVTQSGNTVDPAQFLNQA